MDVLLVEDEDAIAEPLAEGLEREGFRVRRVATGEAALEAPIPDLVLLDLRLPDLDGYDVCRSLRERSDVPIIVVTAKGEEADRVIGLELGADDYVVKPFGSQELVARVEALLRRAPAPGPAVLQERYDDDRLSIDFARRAVTFDGGEVSLTPLEFKLLAAFVRHPRMVLSRDQLLELVWGDAHGVSGDQVKLYVGYLRRKLAPEDPAGVPIETVRGFGYRYNDD
jgi:DNA-binding response OmpR family regulator